MSEAAGSVWNASDLEFVVNMFLTSFDDFGGHGEKKQRVVQKLGAIFERFSGLSTTGGQG